VRLMVLRVKEGPGKQGYTSLIFHTLIMSSCATVVAKIYTPAPTPHTTPVLLSSPPPPVATKPPMTPEERERFRNRYQSHKH
jgi:hypothetical protein